VLGYQCFRGPCCLHLHPEMLVSYIITLCPNLEDHDMVLFNLC